MIRETGNNNVGSFSVIVTVMGDDDEDSLLVREREYCLVEGFVMRTTVRGLG